MSTIKDDLHRYLKAGRAAVLWKLEGLSEYDVRRPLVPTGTNLLGLVKHLASVELGYFGDTFGRPHGEELAWFSENAEANADMWATSDESSADIVGFYERAASHSDSTIDELDLDSPGRVPWWGEKGDVTLHLILIHVATETHRHAGHADIVRELIDGAAGLRQTNDNLPDRDANWWAAYRTTLERTAAEFDG
ncbi:MAG: DinB family protein [Acidimicrobiia bacterium]|nr:DinB family protein [Acidimicrobiia bacterium]MDH5504506.1 DinB family protein [Acidimicrobiia bacterium]